jgi:hypothetical protein
MTFGPGANQCGDTFRRGSDGQCNGCGRGEGYHHSSSNFCYVSTFRRGSDGMCSGCGKSAERFHPTICGTEYCYGYIGVWCCKCVKQRNPSWNFDARACVACKNRQQAPAQGGFGFGQAPAQGGFGGSGFGQAPAQGGFGGGGFGQTPFCVSTFGAQPAAPRSRNEHCIMGRLWRQL